MVRRNGASASVRPNRFASPPGWPGEASVGSESDQLRCCWLWHVATGWLARLACGVCHRQTERIQSIDRQRTSGRTSIDRSIDRGPLAPTDGLTGGLGDPSRMGDTRAPAASAAAGTARLQERTRKRTDAAPAATALARRGRSRGRLSASPFAQRSARARALERMPFDLSMRERVWILTGSLCPRLE